MELNELTRLGILCFDPFLRCNVRADGSCRDPAGKQYPTHMRVHIPNPFPRIPTYKNASLP